MATLADSFMEGLKELGDFEEDHELHDPTCEDLEIISKLQKISNFNNYIQKVVNSHQEVSDIPNIDSECHLICECNDLLMDIDRQITVIHDYIRDRYHHRFPELESLVHHPIDYARVVKKVGNDMDMTPVGLEGLLPSSLIMVISLTASTSPGEPLPQNVLHQIFDACDCAIDLDSARKIFDFMETRMECVAPNLSALVGCSVAAKLIGTAGGLLALANIPIASNTKKKMKNLDEEGIQAYPMQGFLKQTETCQKTPPGLRDDCCSILASKANLVARVDYFRRDPTGKFGKKLHGEISKKIEKKHEPNPPKMAKPLPVPVSAPKKKRGGHRLRKMKLRYAITETRKLANRLMFGMPEESSLGDGLQVGFGMLGHGRCRKKSLSLSTRKLGVKVEKVKGNYGGKRGFVSGLASSLAFTPAEGIQLPNPQAGMHQFGSRIRSTYFM